MDKKLWSVDVTLGTNIQVHADTKEEAEYAAQHQIDICTSWSEAEATEIEEE